MKSCLRECCLSSIRHITANVAIKVETYTHKQRLSDSERVTHKHTHTSPGEALGRIHLLAVSLKQEEEEEEGGRRRGERYVSMVQDQSFAAWKSSSAFSGVPHNLVKYHCSLKSPSDFCCFFSQSRQLYYKLAQSWFLMTHFGKLNWFYFFRPSCTLCTEKERMKSWCCMALWHHTKLYVQRRKENNCEGINKMKSWVFIFVELGMNQPHNLWVWLQGCRVTRLQGTHDLALRFRLMKTIIQVHWATM